jgi:hypothetical protein
MSETTPKRWTRNHTIWLLIVLSVTPGFVAAPSERDGSSSPPGSAEPRSWSAQS